MFSRPTERRHSVQRAPSKLDPVAAYRIADKKSPWGGAIRSVTTGCDTFGHSVVIQCLAKRGRHVQVGLMLGDQADPPIPMSAVIAKELEIYGSHGMQAFEYQRLMKMIETGTLIPSKLVRDTVTLEQGAELLTRMNDFASTGITVIEFD